MNSRIRALLAALIAMWAILPLAANAQSDPCFTLPNGIKFCPPVQEDETTQCVRSINASPTLRPAEACRVAIIKSCRSLSDRDFQRRYAGARPRTLFPKAQEMTAGWNQHCQTRAGYRYAQPPGKQIARKPAPVRRPVRNPVRKPRGEAGTGTRPGTGKPVPLNQIKAMQCALLEGISG